MKTRELCKRCKNHLNWDKYVKMKINICYWCRIEVFPEHIPREQRKKYLIVYCKKYKYDHS